MKPMAIRKPAFLLLCLLAAAPAAAKNSGLVFVSNEKTNNIVVIDPASFKIVKDIKTCRRPRDLHFSTDAVFVTDEAFDFARTVPYRVSRPRPIVASIDLEPAAWHWTWERHGAPQVNSRFERKSGGRHMDGPDWAAWMAVKMIVQSSLPADSADFGKQRAYILGDGSFDGAKGLAVRVRPLGSSVAAGSAAHRAPYQIVADPPIEAFLHRTNTLDTLGDDEPETPCWLGK